MTYIYVNRSFFVFISPKFIQEKTAKFIFLIKLPWHFLLLMISEMHFFQVFVLIIFALILFALKDVPLNIRVTRYSIRSWNIKV